MTNVLEASNGIDPSIDSSVGLSIEDHEWARTGSGQIYKRLQEIGRREGVEVSIEGKNSNIEIFCFGDRKAYLNKSLVGGTTLGTDGTIVPSVESYQIKREPWWKEAIDPLKESLSFLDIPVAWAAKDAGVDNLDEVYRPKDVIKNHNLNKDGMDSLEVIRKIEKIIREALSPVLAPQYSISYEFGGLRLKPLTELAREGNFEDNEVYTAAVTKIKETAPILQALYVNLQ
jgi:hypothetical protein